MSKLFYVLLTPWTTKLECLPPSKPFQASHVRLWLGKHPSLLIMSGSDEDEKKVFFCNDTLASYFLLKSLLEPIGIRRREPPREKGKRGTL